MKLYIDLNTQKQAKTNSTFGQDFYKLMNNFEFGKLVGKVTLRKDKIFLMSKEP